MSKHGHLKMRLKVKKVIKVPMTGKIILFVWNGEFFVLMVLTEGRVDRLNVVSVDCLIYYIVIIEPPHDKTNKMTVCPAKTQISMCIRPV